jgi:predicted FMN-binding regulatory protein PaiB
VTYLPTHFSVADRATQIGVMRAFPFATLVSIAEVAPVFSHVPLVVLERGDAVLGIGSA